MENNTTDSNTMKWVWGGVAVIVIIGLILIVKKDNQPDVPLETFATTEPQTETVTVVSTTTPVVKKPVVRVAPKVSTPVTKPSGNVIRYTNRGFEPSVLEVKRGESVEFVNENDSKVMVIRSHDENPENFYPGFSQEGGPLGKGGKFYFAFTLPGTWLYYNLNGNMEQGAIVVK